VIYLHARIVEDSGRRPTDPAFGTYEYDAILDSLRHAGFVVLSDQRPPRTDSFLATHVARQVDSLRAQVSPRAITVMGFSKGGWIAILASSACGIPRSPCFWSVRSWAFSADLR
jgi:dienelactone hydrolase